jgi:hypothetical protein
MNAQEWKTELCQRSLGPKVAIEAYTRHELGDDELVAKLLQHCREEPDTTWDTLSLLDQYHRRGLLETGLYLTAKTELNLQCFNMQPVFHAAADPSRTLTALDQFSNGTLDRF